MKVGVHFGLFIILFYLFNNNLFVFWVWQKRGKKEYFYFISNFILFFVAREEAVTRVFLYKFLK